MKDYYRILGIDRNSTPREIKQAFRRLAKECHPDKSNDCNDNARFIEARNAYDNLCSEERRQLYDAELTRARRRNSPPIEPLGTPHAHESPWSFVEDRDSASIFDSLLEELLSNFAPRADHRNARRRNRSGRTPIIDEIPFRPHNDLFDVEGQNLETLIEEIFRLFSTRTRFF